jgi:serine/threonine protein phosphatase PrpC
VEPGIRQGETSAKINQDRGCICYPFGPTADGEMTQALFCVFDGHGACGDKVSHYAMNNVQEKLEKHPELISNPNNALKEVCFPLQSPTLCS